MKKVISTYRRWYRIEYFECDNGLYKFAIYDNTGHIQDPRFFKKCDVKDSIAINLTSDDIKEFITTVKNTAIVRLKEEIMENYNFIYKNIFKRIRTLNHVYTVEIHENLDGTYELSINERGFYLKPTIFMDCDTDATYMNAINMTIDDVHAFCNAVHDSDVKK